MYTTFWTFIASAKSDLGFETDLWIILPDYSQNVVYSFLIWDQSSHRVHNACSGVIPRSFWIHIRNDSCNMELDAEQHQHLDSVEFASNLNLKWSGIQIQISGLIQTRVSVRSLRKRSGLIPLSTSVITLSFMKSS